MATAARIFGIPRWRWLPALAYLALIHGLSSLSGDEMPIAPPGGLDKLAHLCEFAFLAALLWWPARARPGGPARAGGPVWPEMKAAAWIFAFVGLNGIADEIHQLFVPGRFASAGDAAADILGGALALAWLLHREKARVY
ncbi:MAG: VanZ family protein [bacterium]